MATRTIENPASEITLPDWLQQVRPTSTPLQASDSPLTAADTAAAVRRISNTQTVSRLQTTYASSAHRLPALDVLISMYNTLDNASAVEFDGIMYSAAWVSTASVISDYYQLSIYLEHEEPSQSTIIHINFHPYNQHTIPSFTSGIIITSAGDITIY